MTYLRAMAAVVAASSEEVGMLNRLTQLLYGVAQVMIPPDPTPNAPAEVKARANTVLGFIKWGSLIAVVGGLLAFGMLTAAAERGGYGSGAAEMKERFGRLLVGGVVTVSAVSIASFVFG